MTQQNNDYREFLEGLNQRIKAAQIRAALAVNREMILFYWDLGRNILEKQEKQGWGAKVIDQLSKDLRHEFPDVHGFSSRNLKYMRKLAEAYPDESIVQQLVAQLPWQVHLEVGGDDFYIDLLFYHLKLRCYVVIEVKSKKFKPADAGQLNFYLSAVDDLMRHSDDQPTIGIIICKDKNEAVAEYALRDIEKPMGISGYEITKALPENLKGSLPTVEELEAELEDTEPLDD